MTTWLRFNAIGLLGCTLQLATLALLHHALPTHDLIATTLALELTLLHNFLWHRHHTWRDRRHAPAFPQLLRFHLTNGALSMLGNLILVRALTHAHVPLLAANAAAIALCSLINFVLADRWAFASTARLRHRALGTATALFFLLAAHAQAQTPHARTRDLCVGPLGIDCAYLNVFYGPSISTADPAAHPGILFGATLGQYFVNTAHRAGPLSPQFELGLAGPFIHGNSADEFVSINEMLAARPTHRNAFVSATAGYTRFITTGNAINFGAALDLGGREDNRLYRIELRDYFVFADQPQHILSIRIAFGRLIRD